MTIRTQPAVVLALLTMAGCLPQAKPVPVEAPVAAAAPAPMPPQPREWLAPSVDMTPPSAVAPWGTAWTRGRALPIALAGHKLVAVGTRLYVLGGLAQREHIGQRDTWTTTIGKDGGLGTWKKGPILPAPVAFHEALVADRRLYVVGGSSKEGMQNLYDTVISAPVTREGGLGKWRTERAMPSKLVYPAAAVLNGRLYVLGGFDGSEYHDTLLYATLNADGSLGEWKTASARYPHRIGRTTMTAVGTGLVVIGGFWSDSQGEHVSSLMLRGTPGPDGNVTEWGSEENLKIASRPLRFSMAEAAGAFDGNFVYLFGGRDPDSLGTATAQASWINPRKGTLTRWQSGPELPLYGVKGAPQTARLYQSSAAIVNRTAYVVGGFLFVRECTPEVWIQKLGAYVEPDWLKAGTK